MTTIYLHIGMPKTGSTYLQKILFDNREMLLKNGILYPVSSIRHNSKDIEDRYCQNLLALFFIDFPKKDDLISKFGSWEELKTEINSINPKNVIISAEAFTSFEVFYKSETIAQVQEFLKDYETKIIIYLRKQDDFLESAYRFMVKLGACRVDIKEFFQEYQYAFDYYQILENWAGVFGSQNIIVRCFNTKNLFDDFLEAINQLDNKNSFNIDSLKKINASPSVKMTKLLLVLNNYNDKFFAKYITKIDNDYWLKYKDFLRILCENKTICKLISNFPSFLIDDVLLSLAEKQSFMKQFEQLNRQVAIKYLGQKDGKLF